MDLGTGTAFVKYIAQYSAANSKTDLLEVVNTGIVFYLCVSVLLLLAAWFGGYGLLSLVGVPPALMDDAYFTLQVGVLVFCLSNAAAPVAAIVPGFQRMDMQLTASMITQTLTAAGTIAVLEAGYGVRGLIVNNLCVAAINTAIMGRYAWKIYPDLRLSVRHWSSAKARTMLGYGTNLQVSKIAQIVTFQTDRIVSLRVFGPLNAAHYDLGVRVNSAARTVTASLVTALIPAVSEMETLSQRDQLAALYERGTKYIVSLAAFLFTFILIFADPLVSAWLGTGYEQTIVFVRILTLGYFANIVTAVASVMTAGLGRTEIDRNYGIVMGVVNIVLTVTLALTVGPYGVAIATSVSLALGSLFFFGAFHRAYGVRHASIARLFIRPLTFAAASLGALRWALDTFFAGPPLAVVAIGTVAGVAVYGWMLVTGRVFDDYDKSKFANVLSSVRKKIGGAGGGA